MGGKEFEGAAGAFLYRKGRVAGLRELGVQRAGDHRYSSAEFHFWRMGYQNHKTAVAAGVCYRVKQNLQRSAPLPQDFLYRVSEAVRAERVRFLGGVFECPSEQAAELGRSCGALAPCPFAQVFKETYLGRTKYLFNPAFLFVIGGANCRMALPEDQPDRPRWLFGGFGGETSALVRCTREVKDMPKWKQDAATFNEDLPFLGDVKQKVTNMQWWRPWIHQLLLYVGTARQSKGARQRQNKKANVARKGKGKGQGKHRLR